MITPPLVTIGTRASPLAMAQTMEAAASLAASNPALAAAVASADLVIPDGAGVVWALGRQQIRVVKTAGIELAWTLLEYAAAHRWRVALVGAIPEVMDTPA